MTVPVWLLIAAAFALLGLTILATWLVERAYRRGWATAYRRAALDQAEHVADRIRHGTDIAVARILAERDHQERLANPAPTLADVEALEDEIDRASPSDGSSPNNPAGGP